MTLRLFRTLALLPFLSLSAQAVNQDQKTLPRGLAPHEKPVVGSRSTEVTDPPTGHIRSLAEWEEAEAVMTLWPNQSLMAAFVAHGPVKLITDGGRSQSWWENWLGNAGISKEKISYFFVKTDSIWIRDYGPWFILDGLGKFGIVKTTYNRPRPNDDKVTKFLASELGIPLYQPGLIHTGGNYYNDGQDNAFSSTLVYSENSSLAKSDVDVRMRSFLGIERYATSKLAPKITIEHMDTFGKLVSPDTWVFSEFPQGSRFRQDSENYVKLLQTLKSPYGTPYKILRLKMRLRSLVLREERVEDYRAYINSFISNKALYFAAYGDEIDDQVKAIYQEALPGYEIVGVDNGNTEWGDSVHCRSRNLLKRNALFLFPRLEGRTLWVEAYPSPGASLVGSPEAKVTESGQEDRTLVLEPAGERLYKGELPEASGARLEIQVSAKDSAGIERTVPDGAPASKINYVIP